MKRSFYGNLSEGDFELAKQMQNPLGDIDSGLSALDYSATSDHSSTDSGSILQHSLNLSSATKSSKTGGSKTLEDDERRRIRRERNKMAAAKCRQKRVDQTNMLLEETQKLEAEQRKLKEDIQNYEKQKEELEFIMESHLLHCNMKKEYASLGRSTPVRIKTEESVANSVEESVRLFADDRDSNKTSLALKSENGKQFLVLHSSAENEPTVGREIKTETCPSEAAKKKLLSGDLPKERSEASRQATVARPNFFTGSTRLGIDSGSSNKQQGTPTLFAIGLEPMIDGHTGLTPIAGLPPFAVSGSQILLTPVISLPTDSFQNLQAPVCPPPSSSS